MNLESLTLHLPNYQTDSPWMVTTFSKRRPFSDHPPKWMHCRILWKPYSFDECFLFRFFKTTARCVTNRSSHSSFHLAWRVPDWEWGKVVMVPLGKARFQARSKLLVPQGLLPTSLKLLWDTQLQFLLKLTWDTKFRVRPKPTWNAQLPARHTWNAQPHARLLMWSAQHHARRPVWNAQPHARRPMWNVPPHARQLMWSVQLRVRRPLSSVQLPARLRHIMSSIRFLTRPTILRLLQVAQDLRAVLLTRALPLVPPATAVWLPGALGWVLWDAGSSGLKDGIQDLLAAVRILGAAVLEAAGAVGAAGVAAAATAAVALGVAVWELFPWDPEVLHAVIMRMIAAVRHKRTVMLPKCPSCYVFWSYSNPTTASLVLNFALLSRHPARVSATPQTVARIKLWMQGTAAPVNLFALRFCFSLYTLVCLFLLLVFSY